MHCYVIHSNVCYSNYCEQNSVVATIQLSVKLALRDHFLTAGWYLLLTGCIDSIINLMASRIGTFGWRDHGATDYGGPVQYSEVCLCLVLFNTVLLHYK